MNRTLGLAAVVGAALALALPASAKTDASKSKDAAHVRWAHDYAAAIAEAKERNCVVFVTIHGEH